MASGGITRVRIGVMVAIGCVVLAVIVATFGTPSGTKSPASASTGRGPATTAVTIPPAAADPGPAADVEPGPEAAEPEASPPVKSPDPTPPAATPEVLPTGGLPTEVAQALTELAAQLEQAGDDGSPRELTREEVDALVTAQLRALGIEL
jgi:hypothetical protein